MNLSKLILAVSICSVFFVSCTNDDDNNGKPLENYDKGVLVLNQGGYGHGDASVSYISDDIFTLQNDIFSLVNPTINLGDSGQDMGFYNEYAYIVLNVSNKIQIVNRYTMQSLGTITTGLNNPRYIAFSNGKGYVTNWGDGGNTEDDYVAVIDLSTNTVSNTIPVVEGPEKIIENAGKLYVAHYGGWGYGNSISVIDAVTSTVTANITVGALPNSMQIKDGSLWVSCGGYPSYVSAPLTETAGKLVRVELVTNEVSAELAYTDAAKHVLNLVIEGSDAYYTVDAGIYKCSLSSNSLPENSIFSIDDQGVYGIYSFAIKNDHIYVGDAGNYVDNGKVYIFSSNPATFGTLEKTYNVGVLPAGFYFNN